MCLILFSADRHARYPLIIAANRDENYARPSAPLAFWPDAPDVVAGRDLEAGGTWLGITRSGRWAALTNYRQAGSYRLDSPSRGHLVSDYLVSGESPERYIRKIRENAERYNGFNLLVGQGTEIYYFSNRTEQHQRVPSGSHGLSNHLLDTPWPKVANGRVLLDALPDMDAAPLTELLLKALQGRDTPLDIELPNTGVGVQKERVLSPPFILSETYGTRASTVILIDRRSVVSIAERAFGPMGKPLGGVDLRFSLDDAVTSSVDTVHTR